MSVLIKGIKVHRGSCWECPCLDGEYGDCNVLEKHVKNVSDEECPLIELPDHGDLVDRDKLYVNTMDYCDLEEKILNAPAVIPAERSEDE